MSLFVGECGGMRKMAGADSLLMILLVSGSSGRVGWALFFEKKKRRRNSYEIRLSYNLFNQACGALFKDAYDTLRLCRMGTQYPAPNLSIALH